MIGAAIALIGAGVVMLVLGVKSYNGSLKPNGTAGLRTKATLASDEAWYAGQKAGALGTIAGAVVCFVGGVVSVVLGLVVDDDAAVTAIKLTLVPLTVVTVMSLIVGNRAAKNAEAQRNTRRA